MRPRAIIRQLYMIGVLSMIIIVISGMFIGVVLSLQGYHTLVRFGAASSLGVLVALSIVRELGPVVTGLMFAGRAGSAPAAELGLLRATAQLSTMEIMAYDPIRNVNDPAPNPGAPAPPMLPTIYPPWS